MSYYVIKSAEGCYFNGEGSGLGWVDFKKYATKYALKQDAVSMCEYLNDTYKYVEAKVVKRTPKPKINVSELQQAFEKANQVVLTLDDSSTRWFVEMLLLQAFLLACSIKAGCENTLNRKT